MSGGPVVSAANPREVVVTIVGSFEDVRGNLLLDMQILLVKRLLAILNSRI